MQEPGWQAMRYGLIGDYCLFKGFKKKAHGRVYLPSNQVHFTLCNTATILGIIPSHFVSIQSFIVAKFSVSQTYMKSFASF
ncbi:hypothetical protein VNO77_01887 [Canavalia gladiata]|uniref:Uncharacterized protein n=1 Tax=Canavalia gladiata TaxID=3824 RepID=A0AAN9MX42_CANGL